ncbi:MAG TPA: hypothetical protein VMP01_19610 [Pirellulaceae bacterium]|nr:hypothetical protein [Pirellulaceae bacterium]
MIRGTLDTTFGRGVDVRRPGQRRLPFDSGRFPLRLVILPALIMCGACEVGTEPGTDGRECLLPAFPQASITLDAEVGDWTGVEPLAVDAQGDDSPLFTGDDLRAVYVAQSSTDVFVRVDLWEDVNRNFRNGYAEEGKDGRYNLRLGIPPPGPFAELSVGIAFDGEVWSVGHNGANSNAPAELQGPSFVAVAGSTIEFRAPLSLIGNPSRFSEVWAEALTTSAEVLDRVGKTCHSN